MQDALRHLEGADDDLMQQLMGHDDDDNDITAIQNRERTYGDMSQRELNDLLNQAIDGKDYEKAREISTYMKESMKPLRKALGKLNEESTWNGGISGQMQFRSGAQIGDTVMYDKQKGYVIGAIGNDLIVQVQGSSYVTNSKEVKVLGLKAETLKPPFKFSKETQKLLFEQYVRCGIFMGNSPIKTNDCYVRYSDWTEATNEQQIPMVVEGQQVLLPKIQIRIFEDVNKFANLDNYVEGVIIDEVTGEAIENVSINVLDYTEAIGDADPVRIIRGGEGTDPITDTVPKATLRTMSV